VLQAFFQARRFDWWRTEDSHYCRSPKGGDGIENWQLSDSAVDQRARRVGEAAWNFHGRSSMLENISWEVPCCFCCTARPSWRFIENASVQPLQSIVECVSVVEWAGLLAASMEQAE
jgi:hypothetical protein